MDCLSSLTNALPPLKISLGLEQLENLSITPWFSYRASWPILPLPIISERPKIKTKRLIVRPILPSDIDTFHELRRISETQIHSQTRGRPDRSKVETQQYIEALNTNEQGHWYFGAFLQSTGEMIGEGGLPDCLNMVGSASGWPEAEFLIKPEYWRQGYGTEMFHALMDSWWSLPREWRRLQLIPVIVGDKEPGDVTPEGVVFQWEANNVAAARFFAKMLDQAVLSADGGFETVDTREGREGNIVKWAGTLAANPRLPQF